MVYKIMGLVKFDSFHPVTDPLVFQPEDHMLVLLLILFILRSIRWILTRFSVSERKGNLSLWMPLGPNAKVENEGLEETYCIVCPCCLTKGSKQWVLHVPSEGDHQESSASFVDTSVHALLQKLLKLLMSFSLVLTGKCHELQVIFWVVLLNWTWHWNGTSSFNCWPKNFGLARSTKKVHESWGFCANNRR